MLLKTLRQFNTLEKKLFWGLTTLLISLSVLYGYLVKATVVDIVARQQAQTISSEISSDIGVSETEYHELQNKITYQYALTLGFREPAKKSFAFRKRFVQSSGDAF